MARQIDYLGRLFEVPDDATDDEVAGIIESMQAEEGVGRGPSSRGRIRNTPGRTAAIASLEGELATRQAASAAADEDLRQAEDVGAIVRPIAQAATGLARGNPLVAIPAMVEEGAEGLTRMAGRDSDRLPRVFRGVTDFLSPEELAPQSTAEQVARTGAEFLGGAASGVALGREVAERGTGAVTKAVGQTLADNPGRQLVGAGTGTAAVEATRAAGGGPIAQTVAGVVGAGAPMVGAKPNAVSSQPRYPKTVAETGLEKARAAGFKVDPGNAARAMIMEHPPGHTPRTPGLIEQGVAGAPKVRAMIALDNAKNVNRLTARELNLNENAPLTERALDDAAKVHEAAYDAVRERVPTLMADRELAAEVDRLGAAYRDNPLLENNSEIEQLRARLMDVSLVSSDNTLAAIRQWRHRANTLFKTLDDPKKVEMAHAYRAAADAYEAALERAAAMSGDPDLINRFRTARTQLAKINDARAALVGENIDPQVIRKLGEKKALSGHMKLIADVATEFDDVMQLPQRIAIPTPDVGGLISGLGYATRRLAGQKLIPHLMSDRFQGKYGEFDPNYQTGLLRDYFPPDRPPPAPAAPSPGPQPGAVPRNPGGLGYELMPDSAPTGPIDVDMALRPPTIFDVGQPPPTNLPEMSSELQALIGAAPEAPPLGAAVPEPSTPGFPPASADDLAALMGATQAPPGPPAAPWAPEWMQALADELIGPQTPPLDALAASLGVDTSPLRLPPPPSPIDARGPYLGVEEGFRDLSLTPGTSRASVQGPRMDNPSVPAPTFNPSEIEVLRSFGLLGDDLELTQEAIPLPAAAGPRLLEGPADLADDLTLNEPPARVAAPEAQGDVAPSAADLAAEMSALRDSKPRPLNKMYGPNPTPEQVASHRAAVRKWDSEYRALSKAQKAALERDNKAFRERGPTE